MSTTIRVRVLPGGVTAKEVNPIEQPDQLNDKYTSSQNPWWTYREDLHAWEEAESKLRTFEIDLPHKDGASILFVLVEGKEYSAEVLNDKTIKIIL